MRLLIIYDTVHGSTERIARAVAEELEAAGHEVSCRRQSISGEEDFLGVELWVIGSPTHWGRAPFRFKALLKNAVKEAGADHAFVAFDTRYDGMHAGAADRTHRMLVNAGLRPLLPPASFIVEGKELRAGEEARARALGQAIAASLR